MIHANYRFADVAKFKNEACCKAQKRSNKFKLASVAAMMLRRQLLAGTFLNLRFMKIHLSSLLIVLVFGLLVPSASAQLNFLIVLGDDKRELDRLLQIEKPLHHTKH